MIAENTDEIIQSCHIIYDYSMHSLNFILYPFELILTLSFIKYYHISPVMVLRSTTLASGPEVKKLFTCLTQIMKFKHLINTEIVRITGALSITTACYFYTIPFHERHGNTAYLHPPSKICLTF